MSSLFRKITDRLLPRTVAAAGCTNDCWCQAFVDNTCVKHCCYTNNCSYRCTNF